jgi:protein-S-isoprenylcysteine O-methyltransferase Ste14
MYNYPEFLNLKFLDLMLVQVIAGAWLGIGVIFWVWSAVYFLKYFIPGNLITKGPFSLCRNPIYSSIIVFIIPSIGLFFHSGLILSMALVLYLVFRISIHGETSVLRRIFGSEYEQYERSVNVIIPFPRHFIR